MPKSYYSDITLELCADAATLLAQNDRQDLREALEWEDNGGAGLHALRPAILKWSGLGMDGPVAEALEKLVKTLPAGWYFETRVEDGGETFLRGELLGKTNPLAIAFDQIAWNYGKDTAAKWARELAEESAKPEKKPKSAHKA